MERTLINMNGSADTKKYDGADKMEVLVLAGGLGSRLKSVVADRPKILALVDGRPFLDILVEQLSAQKVARIILCLGHLKEQVVEYVREKTTEDPMFELLEFVLEEKPLGTGGAIKNAMELIRQEHFFVLNGDSLWSSIDLTDLYNFHIMKNASVSIVLSPQKESHKYGRVLVDDRERVVQFMEKENLPGEGLVSAGIYLMRKDVLSQMGDTETFSLEYDVFPILAKNGLCYGLTIEGDFLDIGTPERYKMAKDFLQDLE